MKKLTLTFAITASALIAGCSSGDSWQCDEVAKLYTDVHELREYLPMTKSVRDERAKAFMVERIEGKNGIDNYTREILLSRVDGAIKSVFDNPDISSDEWESKIYSQCISELPLGPLDSESK